jgi:hypothetical protein
MSAAISIPVLDIDSLRKGQSIPQATIERHLGCTYRTSPEAYALGALALAGQIEKHTGYHTGVVGREVRIFSDIESCQRTASGTKKGIRAIGRAAKRREKIDRSSFDPTQVKTADTRDTFVTGCQIALQKELRAQSRARRLAEKVAPPSDDTEAAE